MKSLPDIALSLRLNRRGFIAGTGVILFGLSLSDRRNIVPRPPKIRTLQRAVFQQVPYFDFTGHGETYTPPHGNQATRGYLAGLSREEFLRRHWFS